MKPFEALAAALVIAFAPVLALAQEAIREVRVQFPRGATTTTLKGTLKGREIIDYKLGAAAGGLIGSIVTATVGAVVLLFLIGLIKKA